MKKILTLACLLTALTAAPALTALAAPPAPPPAGQLPQPRIVVFDERALAISKAGQDVSRQVQELARKLAADRDAQQRSLQSEAAQLQQKAAILSPDARAKLQTDFQAKARGAEASLSRREQQINGGVQMAQQKISQALQPIIQQLMKQRGANLVVLKQAILYSSTNAFDITQDAIRALDTKLTSVKVDLVNPPAPKK